MRKIVFLWIALIAASMNAFADGKVSFTASAPDAVAVGDQFRLSYTVTTQKVRDSYWLQSVLSIRKLFFSYIIPIMFVTNLFPDDLLEVPAAFSLYPAHPSRLA